MEQLKCEICGGRLEVQSGGACQCLDCGLSYSQKRVRELLSQLKADAAESGAPERGSGTASAPAAEAPREREPSSQETKEEEIRRLQEQQQILLAEIRLADGLFGPSQRRELSLKLRRLERRLAKLQGSKPPFFWF